MLVSEIPSPKFPNRLVVAEKDTQAAAHILGVQALPQVVKRLSRVRGVSQDVKQGATQELASVGQDHAPVT